MMKQKLFGLLLTLACVSSASTVMAHTALAIADPKDGAMVMEAPESLSLTFTESVRLMRMTMKMGETELDIGFSPVAAASDQFVIALPALENGSYTVNWAVMGGDSHLVDGNLSFSVGMHGDHENHASHEGVSHESHESHSESNHDQ
ncbi:MAG: methionine-rich copper-binding protein CopC [Pseudohongiellaceae bacterium]|jgi:methionine-rich copper-binding protein CopC